MKYLHIMSPSQRMMKNFIFMLNDNFDINEHKILYNQAAKGLDQGMLNFPNAIDFLSLGSGKIKKFKSYKSLFSKADHIIFHQFSPNIPLLVFLFFNKRFLDKSIWLIWGIDLYNYKYENPNLKERILNYLGMKCRNAIGIPVVLLPTDAEVYQKEFGNQKTVLCAPYPTTEEIFDYLDSVVKKEKVLKENSLNKEQEIQEKPLRIMVGHNAHSFNRHIQILDNLKHFSRENIQIYMPISYGNDGAQKVNDYKPKIKGYAAILFDEKVLVDEKLMSKRKYDNRLATVDIAVLECQPFSVQFFLEFKPLNSHGVR